MRKLLFTTVFMLPLAAAPVLAQDTQTPPAAPEATEPMADPATDAAAVEAAAEEAAAAEAAAAVADSGKVAQQQAANELRIDWITGTTVTAPDGVEIGKIGDLIVDGESGQMIAAIVGVGGFLGMGEKQIAVPFDQLSVNYDAQEIVSTLTKDEAEAAPEYVFREREAAPGLVNDPATMPTDPAAAPTDPAVEPTTIEPAPVEPVPADPAAMPAETETAPTN